MKKKGLSNIVINVLLVLLALAAVIIMWAFVRVFIIESTESIGLEEINTRLEIPDPYVKLKDNTNVIFHVVRESGDADMKSLVIILEGGGKSVSIRKEDVDLNVLESVSLEINYAEKGICTLSSISVAPVFVDADGKESIGRISDKYVIKGNEQLVNDQVNPRELVSWWNFANPGAIQNGIKANSWTWFVNNYVQPQINWGVKRFILFEPFGDDSSIGPQRFDELIHTTEAGNGWVDDNFVEAWKPITDQGVEVIAYMGKLYEDPDFTALEGDQNAWDERFDASIAPVLASGMSIGLDASSGAPADSTTYTAALRLLNEYKVKKVYIEDRPNIGFNHWCSWPIISTRDSWKNPNSYHLPAELLTGEHLHWINAPPTGEQWSNSLQWMPGEMRDIWNEGGTVITNPQTFINNGISLNDLTQ